MIEKRHPARERTVTCLLYLPWTSAVLILLSANRGWHGSNFFRNSICRGIHVGFGRPAGPDA
jgi:hypothetical protein